MRSAPARARYLVPPRKRSFRRRRLRLEVDELEVDHVSRVPWAGPQLDDPRIAARPLREAGADVGEEAVDNLLRAQVRERLPPCVEIAALAERDHLLGERLDRLRLRLRRLDPAVLDQRAGEIRVQRLAVRGVAAELLSGALVAHQPSRLPAPPPLSPRRLSPCACRVSLTSSIDFLPKFGIAASSFSVFITRSPIVSMPTRFRQLYERTPSSSSSIGKFSIPCASDAAGAPPSVEAAAASPKPSIFSISVKIASWRIRISAACPIASFGSIDPSVVMSIVSLS